MSDGHHNVSPALHTHWMKSFNIHYTVIKHCNITICAPQAIRIQIRYVSMAEFNNKWHRISTCSQLTSAIDRKCSCVSAVSWASASNACRWSMGKDSITQHVLCCRWRPYPQVITISQVFYCIFYNDYVVTFTGLNFCGFHGSATIRNSFIPRKFTQGFSYIATLRPCNHESKTQKLWYLANRKSLLPWKLKHIQCQKHIWRHN